VKDVEYTGRAQSATVTDVAFQSQGVESRTVTWNGKGDIQQISNEAAAFLVKADGSRFAIVEPVDNPDRSQDED